MSSRIPASTVDDRSQQYAVPAYNPSDYYTTHVAPIDYSAPVPPLSENPSQGLRTPGLPMRHPGARSSATSILLDRFLSPQAHSTLQPPETPKTTAYQAYGTDSAVPSGKSPGWLYAQTPVMPENPRSVWSFMRQGQVSLSTLTSDPNSSMSAHPSSTTWSTSHRQLIVSYAFCGQRDCSSSGGTWHDAARLSTTIIPPAGKNSSTTSAKSSRACGCSTEDSFLPCPSI